MPSNSKWILYREGFDYLTVLEILGVENRGTSMKCRLNDEAVPKRKPIAAHRFDRFQNNLSIDPRCWELRQIPHGAFRLLVRQSRR
jgi:hypothetical protein